MKTLVFVIAVFLPVLVAPALADWDVGDPYKMHYPQLPKPGGMDVEFSASTLADDWQCTETGPVGDIHFWVSWMQNNVQPIPFINVQIFSDNPDPDGTGPAYSRPGQPLWSHQFQAGQFAVQDMPDDLQDWYDPSEQWPFNYGENDHTKWQQINIKPILDPFIQQAGTVYWLAINFGTLPFIGWKESGSPHFNDDAVWLDRFGNWMELRHPDPLQNYSLDLAFVITPEPATLCLLAIGAICMRRYRR